MKEDIICQCCGAKQKIWNIIDNWFLLNGKEYCPPCYRKLKNQNEKTKTHEKR